MQASSISWTDSTWNVGDGCLRVSEGCRNCYAERMAMRFSDPGKPYHGLVRRRDVVVDGELQVHAQWTGEVKFHADRLLLPLSWRQPRKIFVNSMSDVFYEQFTDDQIAAIYGVMAATPRHTYQVLTKRGKRMREWYRRVARDAASCNNGRGMTIAAYCYIQAARMFGETPQRLRDHLGFAMEATWPLPNVWIGVSCENQDAADARIPDLLETPAAIRFLSCEPLLGPIDLFHIRPGHGFIDAVGRIDWVIVGCESGPRARGCDYRWIRQIVHACDGTTKVFLKQASRTDEESAIGEPIIHGIAVDENLPTAPRLKAGGVIERPYLDGKQWLQFPRAT